jgi:hypothetical protein
MSGVGHFRQPAEDAVTTPHRSTWRRRTAAAAIAVLCCATQAAAQTGGFVVTLGTDTVQVERFARTTTRLEGTVVTRIPRTLIIRWALDLSPDGLPARYVVATTLGDGKPTTSTGQATYSYDADSLTRTLTVNGQPVTHRIAATPPVFPGPPIPYLGVSVAMYELAFAAARRGADASGESAIHLLTLVRQQTRSYPTRIWFIGSDSVEMDYFGVTKSGFRLDADGRIARADWSATTYKYRMLRVPDVDVDATARLWHERDQRGGIAGALSPADSVRASAAGAAITVRYSRPARRGRVIWGGLVPWDSVWRFGADFATHLTTSADLRVGGASVGAGQYTLWMVPSANGEARLIISTLTNVWGTAYNPARDLARVPMSRTTLGEPVERFTIAIENDRLAARWDTTEWSVPLAQAPALTTPAAWRPTNLIPFGDDSADITSIKDGVEQFVGRTSWTIRRAECEGRAGIEFRVGTGRTYVSCIDAATHAPITTRYRTSRDSFDVRFRGNEAHGWVVWGGQPRREIADTLARLPFLGVAVEHMLGAFPLADGYTTEVEFYAPYAPVTRNVLKVLESARLSFRGETRDTWLVQLTSATRPGANERRFWIDKATGRLLHRENGVPGGTRVVQRTR